MRLHLRKYKLCANAFGVQQDYINRHVLQTLTQGWPEPLTVCALCQNTTESTPQGQPVHTRSSREIHGRAQLIMLTAKDFILAHCGLIRWISFFLSHRGTLMVFLLTCDLLTAIRIYIVCINQVGYYRCDYGAITVAVTGLLIIVVKENL